MYIRKSTEADIDRIMEIYSYAREFMIEQVNHIIQIFRIRRRLMSV